jgi:hypothetical protein
LPSDFVRTWASWFSVPMNSTAIRSLLALSQTIWYFTSMCLLCPLRTGFFISPMADLLSIFKRGAPGAAPAYQPAPCSTREPEK